jgi:hypothetical protein
MDQKFIEILIGENCASRSKQVMSALVVDGIDLLSLVTVQPNEAVPTRQQIEKQDLLSLVTVQPNEAVPTRQKIAQQAASANVSLSMTQIKTDLSSSISMKDIGPIHHVLVLTITRSENGIQQSNRSLIEKYAAQFHCIPPTSFTTIPSLLSPSDLNSIDSSLGFASFSSLSILSSVEYLSHVGALMYLSRRTRPDIAAVTGHLARRQTHFTLNDCIHLKRVFLYLYLTRDYSLSLRSDNLSLSVYVDADWAGANTGDRRSITGVSVYLGSSPVNWISKRQDSIALSTSEAEFYSITEGINEIKMFKNLLQEAFNISTNEPIKLFCDNQSAIATGLGLGNVRKTRHMELRYNYIKRALQYDKIASLEFIPSAQNRADFLTKFLGTSKAVQANQSFGLVKNNPPLLLENKLATLLQCPVRRFQHQCIN